MVEAAKSASMAVDGFSNSINCFGFGSSCAATAIDGPSMCLVTSDSLFVSCTISLLTSFAERLVVVVLLKVVLPRYGFVTIGAADDEGNCVEDLTGAADVGTATGIGTEANVLETGALLFELVDSFGVVGVVPIVIGTGNVELAVLVVTVKLTVVATAETSLGRVNAAIGVPEVEVDVTALLVTLSMSLL